jgi:K+-sensing histidine kinase KdpD
VVFELSQHEDHERGQQHDRSVIIRVKNEGELIPQGVLDNLFRGMTSHRTAKSDTPHLGIGLYVAHQIARFHGGKLQITNRRDKHGVEVSLVLPRI